MDDYYKILNLKRTATSKEIRKAYRALAKKYHPDSNNNNPKTVKLFNSVNEAYKVLSDEKKRSEYDNKLFGHEERSNNRNTGSKNTSTGTSNRERNMNMNAGDFANINNAFESFFGFDPKGDGHNLGKENDKVKPMKTKDAFEHIFGGNYKKGD